MHPCCFAFGVFSIGLILSARPAGATTPLYLGGTDDLPCPADFNGDGRADLSIYDSGKGELSARLLGGDELAFDLDLAPAGFDAAMADYDGDGLTDLGAYDCAGGALYACLSSRGYQPAGIPLAPGTASMALVPADYDGDRKADPALFDSASGAWLIYPSASGYQSLSFILGAPGATAVPMDFDGDGKADPCAYDEGTGLWATLCSASSYAYTWIVYGGPGCAAAPADFDGDARADPAVYNVALGVWGVLHSSSNFAPCLKIQGGPGCVPVPGNYYFTNRADYALYNPDEARWQVSYDRVQGGIIAKIAFLIIGQLLSKIDDFTLINTKKNNDGQQCLEQLREVNRKLDTLLENQAAIQAQLDNLVRQLQYESEKTRLLIEGLSARDAITKIKTYFDFGGIDGYQTFYQCDTNNLPPNDAVLYFANAVLDNGVKEAVTEIHDAILPSELGSGLLRQWAALSAFTLTLDNLADHHAAFYDYFMNLYAYQMKGVCMYVDSAQVANTSAWAKAVTYAYVTNDVMGMIEAEVNEFRAVTYDMVLRALNANYNPYATNNPFSPFPDTNAHEILATTEFMARQCQGQTQGLCTTFLVVDRPEAVSNYNRVTAVRLDQEEPAERWPLAVATNRMESKPYYGYMNPDLRNITIADDYAVLRHDFGQVPVGAYRVYNSSGRVLGDVTVTNYDDYMNPTNDPSITNWFGHLADASSFYLTQLALPVESTNEWSLYTAEYYHYKDKWSNTRIFDAWPQSLKNFNLGMKLWYEYNSAYHLPDAHGGYNFTYFAFPFALSNSIGSNVQIRVHFRADNTRLVVDHKVEGLRAKKHGQYFRINESGGSVRFFQSTGSGVVTNSAGWLTTTGCWREDTSRYIEHYSWETNIYTGCLSADLQPTASQTSTVAVAFGGAVQPWQDCWMGGVVWDEVDVWTEATISYSLRNAILSFY